MIKTLSLNLPFVSKKNSFNHEGVLRAIQFLAVLTVMSLFGLYLLQVNQFIAERYSVQKHQRDLNRLTSESKSLEVNSLEANSLNNITTSLEGLGLERVNKTYYIRVLDTKVVTK